MIIKPRVRGFLCTTTHPVGCDANVKRQIDYRTMRFVAWANEELAKRPARGDPHLARTLFTRDCVAKGLHFDAGGARYNWSVVSYHGLANAADSLMAVLKA